jgi:hypothetical protein
MCVHVPESRDNEFTCAIHYMGVGRNARASGNTEDTVPKDNDGLVGDQASGADVYDSGVREHEWRERVYLLLATGERQMWKE